MSPPSPLYSDILRGGVASDQSKKQPPTGAERKFEGSQTLRRKQGPIMVDVIKNDVAVVETRFDTNMDPFTIESKAVRLINSNNAYALLTPGEELRPVVERDRQVSRHKYTTIQFESRRVDFRDGTQFLVLGYHESLLKMHRSQYWNLQFTQLEQARHIVVLLEAAYASVKELEGHEGLLDPMKQYWGQLNHGNGPEYTYSILVDHYDKETGTLRPWKKLTEGEADACLTDDQKMKSNAVLEQLTKWKHLHEQLQNEDASYHPDPDHPDHLRVKIIKQIRSIRFLKFVK
ncbi:Uu.00g128640.m01.CDS01 [Anthostomella pinea]|uniref:Uu.00g128640.m01.CDS01 n=1 Tax=Anthostomella pinea TaxID=933095 RepID=A0AAI8VJA2_9PEZI|nr:Uu.00g128640.m01.CDS01 [Anthostomella pinea]